MTQATVAFMYWATQKVELEKAATSCCLVPDARQVVLDSRSAKKVVGFQRHLPRKSSDRTTLELEFTCKTAREITITSAKIATHSR